MLAVSFGCAADLVVATAAVGPAVKTAEWNSISTT
jgi:hypothetical protein